MNNKCYSCGKHDVELFKHKGLLYQSGSHYYCEVCLSHRGIKVVSVLSNRKS